MSVGAHGMMLNQHARVRDQAGSFTATGTMCVTSAQALEGRPHLGVLYNVSEARGRAAVLVDSGMRC